MTIKEMKAQLAAMKARGLAATAAYQRLAALAARTEAQEAELNALDGELTTLEADVTRLSADIAAQERVQARQNLFSSAAPSPVNTDPLRASLPGFRTEREPTPGSGGFKAMAEFAHAVMQVRTAGQIDPRLAAIPADVDVSFGASTPPTTWNQNAGTGGEGFLVPPDFRQKIWEIAYDERDLLGMVGAEPTQANAVMVPRDETTPWGAAGVQAYWASETGQLKGSKANLTGALMNLHKLYAFVMASDELLADAPMLNDRLTRQAGRAIKWKASEAIFSGTGAGQPLGIQKSAALVTQAKDTGQQTNTVTVTNLTGMMRSILRVGGTPLWIINQDCVGALAGLTYANGWPAWMPSNAPLQSSPFDGQLLGFPVMFSEHASAFSQLGDITLVNLDGYYAATKSEGGLNFAASIHLFFDLDSTAFRWTFRLAGQPLLSAPITPPKSTTLRSHFVTLAAR